VDVELTDLRFVPVAVFSRLVALDALAGPFLGCAELNGSVLVV